MDVDIDVPPSLTPLSLFPNWVRASIVRDDRLVPHPCGYYPQAIAKDGITGLSAIPYESAEEIGFLKVDFLTLHIYQHMTNRAEVEQLVKQEPNWSLLLLPSTHAKLFQLAKHGDLLLDLKPKNLEELADVMALIRPGKKNFLGLYKKDKIAARRILYAKDDSGYSFKKSHSFAYALVVKIQLMLIEMGRL